MYLPSQFVPADTASLHALMRAAPLATLVVPTAAGLQARLRSKSHRPGS